MPDLFWLGPDKGWRKVEKPSDLDAVLKSLYTGVQQRLIEDGLLRSAVSRVRGESALDRVEDDFIHWTEDTEFPQFINGLTASIGEKVK